MSTESRPDGCLIWVLSETAAEAGPAPVIARAVAERLERPVTALVTPLDDGPLVPGVAGKVIHQLAPGDTEGTITRFLDHWSPDFGLVIGQPARPNLLNAAYKRDVTLYHASSRRAGAAQTRRYPGYFKYFTTCFAASATEANHLRTQLRNTGTEVDITGPLADTVLALPCDDTECTRLTQGLGGRPVWLAADVGTDEIAIIEQAHRKAFRSAHRLLLILVPRERDETGAIVRSLEEKGWRVAQRAMHEEPDSETQIYLGDTEDELGLWYRLAPASFIGGTLQPSIEPSDPFAAAALGSAVLCGPNHGRNPARFAALAAQSACLPVSNADELGEAVITLLAPDKAASLAQSGWSVTTESAHVVERIAEVIEARVYEREDAL